MLKRDFITHAKLHQLAKDVGIILDIASESGLELPLSRIHASMIKRLLKEGHGNLDNSAIMKVYHRG